MFQRTLVLALAVAASGTAFAADKCQAGPKDQWQAKEALEKKLVAEGWKVKRMKVEDGCYEVYGFDAKGQKTESFFNPKTFEAVK